MASFTRGTTFVDGVANDVTAAKLAALVDNATPTSGLIQDRTAETSIAVNDTLLIGDASDSNNLKRMTVANFAGTLPTATITSGTITNLASTTGTIATLNSTTGTIATFNSTTGTIANLVVTTSTFLGAITGSTNVINIGSGQIYKDASGNVGIGITPNEALNINGSTNLKSAIRLLNQGTDVGFIATEAARIGSGSSNNLSISSFGTNSVVLATGSTERLRINSSGNVGIGTTSPAGKLDVYDATSSILNVLGNATVQAVVYKGSADTTAPVLILRKSRGSVESPAAVATGDQVGNINFQAFGGTNNRGVSRITGNVEAYVSDSDISSNLVFLTSTAGGATATEKLRIDSSGNVSIGTATALSRLHVHGDLTMSNATVSTTAATGGLALPATAAGYLTVSINGTSRKIPYYA